MGRHDAVLGLLRSRRARKEADCHDNTHRELQGSSWARELVQWVPALWGSSAMGWWHRETAAAGRSNLAAGRATEA